MSTDATSLYVDRHYRMDPEFDDLIYGTDLRDGMVVLQEDPMLRGDPERMDRDRYERDRCWISNRWATVTNLRLIPRPECGSPLVKFIAVYGDGSKATRSYDAGYAWIVKRDSLTGGPGVNDG